MRQIVSQFIEERKRDRDAEAKTRQPGKSRRLLWLGLLGAAGAVVWLVPARSSLPSIDTAQRTAAGIRLEVYMAARRVSAYRGEHGRLPASLATIGITAAWLSLTTLDDSTFEVTANTGTTRVAYRSTMPDSVFFGDTKAILDPAGAGL